MDAQFQYSLSVRQEQPVEKHFLGNPYHFRAQRSTARESQKLTANHMHNYIQLWYVLRGGFRHIWNGVEYFQKEGDFLIIPPRFSHQLDTRGTVDMEFIFCELTDGFLSIFPDSKEKSTLFNLAYLQPLLCSAEQMKPYLTFHGPAKERLEALLLQIVAEYNAMNNLSSTVLRSLILRLLTVVAQEYEGMALLENDLVFSKYRAAIQDALDYIDAHYTEIISLEQISKIALMSVRSFSYVFKEITKKTFLEYVHFLRIRRACELLKNTDMTATEICMECGFCHAAYFSRIFKKLIGCPPHTYRKNARSGTHL